MLPITATGTGLMVCAVYMLPALSRIFSTLPWSAVTTRKAVPPPSTASMMRPRLASTASQALTAASRSPVWPTMSPLAKLTTVKKHWSLVMRSIAALVTRITLISGLRS